MDAAEQLMSQRAPEEIRIEDVATQAGISPASVYVHFGTKDALMAAVTERVLAVATESLRSAYAAETSPLERFAGVGSAYLRLLLDHPAVVKYLTVTGERGPGTPVEDRGGRAVQPAARRVRGEHPGRGGGGRHPAGRPRADVVLPLRRLERRRRPGLRRDALAMPTERVEQAVVEAGLVLLEGLIVETPQE